MASPAERSWKWLARRLAARRVTPDASDAGLQAALDGMTAVAVAESLWCDAAGLAAGFPASLACRAWQRLAGAGHLNAFGSPPRSIAADSPAGAVAATTGATSAGMRATAFLAGDDLAASTPLLRRAAQRRLPLVVHAAVDSHDWLFAAADLGCIVLIATNAQEAVDLALAARLAAERSLTPAIVAVDALETGAGAQSLRLPDPDLVRELLGETTKRDRPPTPAQRTLFGEYRARTPRRHDLDQPVMTGAAEDSRTTPLAAPAARPYFTDHVPGLLSEALAAVAERTGRPLDPVGIHHAKNAELLLVVSGSSAETACHVVDALRAEKLRVGVAAVRSLRPWAGEALAEGTRGTRTILVLERADAPLAQDGPLARHLRASLPAGDTTPTICRGVHGIGGHAATAADLAHLCRATLESPRPLAYLGVEFLPKAVSPKQQVTFDAVRRDYPGIESLSVRAPRDASPPDSDALRLAVVRPAGATDEPLAGLCAHLLHTLTARPLRSLPDLSPSRRRTFCIDRLLLGEPPRTPGHDEPVDLAVLAATALPADTRPTRCVRDGGTLLIPREIDSNAPVALTAADLDDASRRGIRLVLVPFDPPKAYEHPEPAWRRHEALLGALVTTIGSLPNIKKIPVSKAEGARRELLEREESPYSDARLSAFRAGHNGAADADTRALTPAPPPEPDPAPPELLRRAGASRQPVSDLPGFWDRRGSSLEEAADPFAAYPAVPALSSALRPIADPDGLLVGFDPETCDGNGRVWTSCPDGSVGAVALSAQQILEAGVALAAEAGRSADALGPVLAKLAQQVHKLALSADRAPTNVREACEDAWAWLIDKMAPPEDRRASLESGFRAVLDTVGMLPIARTFPFFDEPENEKAGSGAFLVVGTNPDACSHARAAVGPCEGHGLKLVERTPANLERARLLWRIFEALPDTPGATIERVAGHEAVGPLAAMMLAKSCAQALAPGDAAEAGSGARTALRFVLASCEAEVQPHVVRMLGEIRALREKLATRIHDTLADSLPDQDLDALAEGLRSLGRDDVDLHGLSATLSNAVNARRVDAVSLGRTVEAARALADLEWKLTTGPTGLGRARTGVAITTGSTTLWAVSSPLNPFIGPVTVDAGGWTPELARGLCEGQMHATLEAVRVVRWARAELDSPGDASRAVGRLRALRWDDLTPEERALCPPLLLVGDDGSLVTGGLGSLLWLLRSTLPVKALVLTGAGGRAQESLGAEALGGYPGGARAALGLLALLARTAYVAQCSIADGDHLGVSLRRALAFDGPALLHVHAPSPRAHGFAPEHTLRQAALGVASRAHCLFRFDPSAGGVFGSCLDLTGNPDPLETFARDGARTITPLDWLITEARFRDGFRQPESGESPMEGEALLTMPTPERAGKPAKATDPLDRSAWIASDELIAFATDRLRLWRTLQELSGLVTPFTQRVREDAERTVAGDRAAEIAKLTREHEAALASLRAEFEADAVGRVRDGLMRLAGYAGEDASGAGNGAGDR